MHYRNVMLLYTQYNHVNVFGLPIAEKNLKFGLKKHCYDFLLHWISNMQFKHPMTINMHDKRGNCPALHTVARTPDTGIEDGLSSLPTNPTYIVEVWEAIKGRKSISRIMLVWAVWKFHWEHLNIHSVKIILICRSSYDLCEITLC